MTEILKPTDPRWDDFIISLIKHLNPRMEKSAGEGEPDHLNFDCDATFRLCRNILETRYPEIDTDATLRYFRQNQWYCDCDVFVENPTGLGVPRGSNP